MKLLGREETLERPAADSLGVVARRVDLPCAAAGFEPPPCQVHLKFMNAGERWSLLALTNPGRPPAIARWLEAYSPVSIQVAPGLSPKYLRAEFEQLPNPWARLLSAVVIHSLELTPEGTASIFIEDSEERIERFVRDMGLTSPAIRARKTHFGPQAVQLTARQLEVLSLAVALGYYELPHKLNLRALAQKLGLSVGAVSELLRRGESLIINSYVDSLAELQWASAAAKI